MQIQILLVRNGIIFTLSILKKTCILHPYSIHGFLQTRSSGVPTRQEKILWQEPTLTIMFQNHLKWNHCVLHTMVKVKSWCCCSWLEATLFQHHQCCQKLATAASGFHTSNQNILKLQLLIAEGVFQYCDWVYDHKGNGVWNEPVEQPISIKNNYDCTPVQCKLYHRTITKPPWNTQLCLCQSMWLDQPKVKTFTIWTAFFNHILLFNNISEWEGSSIWTMCCCQYKY